MARRHYNNNAAPTTTTAAITNTATTFSVVDLSTYPTTFPYIAVLDAGLTTAEVILVTAATGNTITACTRGYDGTSAQAHAASAAFQHSASSMDYDEANAHVNGSVGVHGLAGAVVGTSDTQTLTNKTLTSPVVNSPTVNGGTLTGTISGGALTPASVASSGAVSGTTVSASGNATVGGTLSVTGTSSLTGNATFGGTVAASGQITAPSKVAPNEMIQLTFLDQLTNTGDTWVNNCASPDINSLGCAMLNSAWSAVVIPAGKGGKYRVSGKVAVTTTSGRITASARNQSGNYLLAATVPSATGGTTMVTFGPKVLTLAAGDTIKLFAYPTQAGNFDLPAGTAGDTYLLVERIA